MSKAARVQSIDVIKQFRAALLTFSEKVTNGLGEADSEIQRVTSWLENEQTLHWAGEHRRRQAELMKAKEALRFKQIFKSPTGGKQSTVDEERAVTLCARRVAEAEDKIVNVKKWIRQLHKESHMYRGAVQRLATTVSTDLPNAAAKMERMVRALEGYVALNAPAPDLLAESGDGSGMSRGSAEPHIAGDKRFRQYSPTAAQRDAAEATDPSAKPWTSGEFGIGDAGAIDQLKLERDVMDRGSPVILAAGVATAKRIYLERQATAFPGDSGWYIGIADDVQPGTFEAAKIQQVLACRPHFADLLALPLGTLIVIDAAGVNVVLNAEDENVWKAGEAAPTSPENTA